MYCVGVPGHPEPEGACGVAPDRVSLVSTVEEVALLEPPDGDLLVTNQTTMSQWDIKPVIDAIRARFPSAWFTPRSVSQRRFRQAVAEQAVGADLLVVVGDPRSNNSRRLAEGRARRRRVSVVQVRSDLGVAARAAAGRW